MKKLNKILLPLAFLSILKFAVADNVPIYNLPLIGASTATINDVVPIANSTQTRRVRLFDLINLQPFQQISISHGGTGQSTASTAINALLPSQTGNNGKFLKTDGTNPSWDTAGTLNSFINFGFAPNDSAATVIGNTIRLEPADATHPGGMSTGTQTIAGQKTFPDGLIGSLTGTASGNTTYTANNHGTVVSSGTNAMTVVAPDALSNKLYKSNGVSADPSWVAVSGEATMNGSGSFFLNNDSVISKVLNGFISTPGTVGPSDTILSAIEKLDNSISGGVVTSVALADASSTAIYVITGSPVTTSGTLTITLQDQGSNAVFAGPSTGSASQPSFRSLVPADIPALPYVTNVLADGKIFVGDVSNVATAQTPSGELTMSNSGVFTLDNDSVIGKLLTGFVSGAGTVTSSDSVLSAIEKIDGNVSALDGFTYPNATSAFGGNNAAAPASPGDYTTVIGVGAGVTLSGAGSNSFFGYNAGNLVSSGMNNVVIGRLAGDELDTGSRNVIIGAANGSVTTGSNNIFIGTEANAGDGTRSNQIGIGDSANPNGASNIAIGYSANAGNGGSNDYDAAIAIGFDSAATNNASLAIGYQAKAQRLRNMVFGRNMSDAGATDDVLIFGDGGTGSQYEAVSASNQISFGSNTSALKDMFIGNGAVDVAAPVDVSIQPTSVVTGTSDTAGADMTINGGKSTGDQPGGSVIIKTAPAGTSGSTQNPLVTAVTINSQGSVFTAGEVRADNKVLATGLRSITDVTGTDYTFLFPDGSGAGLSPVVKFTNAASVAAYVPAYADIPFPIGTQIDIAQIGTGQVTLAGSVGVTVNAANGAYSTSFQYGTATLLKIGTDEWILFGGLVP